MRPSFPRSVQHARKAEMRTRFANCPFDFPTSSREIRQSIYSRLVNGESTGSIGLLEFRRYDARTPGAYRSRSSSRRFRVCDPPSHGSNSASANRFSSWPVAPRRGVSVWSQIRFANGGNACAEGEDSDYGPPSEQESRSNQLPPEEEALRYRPHQLGRGISARFESRVE